MGAATSFDACGHVKKCSAVERLAPVPYAAITRHLPGALPSSSPTTPASRGAQKLRSAVLRATIDLKQFRRHLQPLYETPADAFDDFAAGHQNLDRAAFLLRARELGFPGNAERLFELLSNGDRSISRKDFRRRMALVNEKDESKAGKRFADVVELAARSAGLDPGDAAKAAAKMAFRRSGSGAVAGDAKVKHMSFKRK